MKNFSKDRRLIKKRARYFTTEYFGYFTGVQLLYTCFIFITVGLSMAIPWFWPIFAAFILYPAICGLSFFYLNASVNRMNYRNLYSGFKRLSTTANTALTLIIIGWLIALVLTMLQISNAAAVKAIFFVIGILFIFLPLLLMTESWNGIAAMKRAANLAIHNILEIVIAFLSVLIYPLVIYVLGLVYAIGNNSENIKTLLNYDWVVSVFPSIGEMTFTLQTTGSALIIFAIVVIAIYFVHLLSLMIAMYFVKFTQPEEFNAHNVIFAARKEREEFRDQNEKSKQKTNFTSAEGFVKGDVVVHPEFGEGKIIQIKRDNKRGIELALISFVDKGQKIIEITPGLLKKVEKGNNGSK